MLGSTIGGYTIARELGEGGMGTVYLGENNGQRAAIKVVHPHLIATPGFFKRFLREAELGRKVRHRNVVQTFDADATLVDGKQVNFMVMEYVEGRSLRDLVNELRTVPEALLREIAQQAAAGLAAIHAHDIVHRDLKPENILITDDNEIRIMDLGVAKLQEASIALTREGQFAGSLLYAAPEQFKRDLPVGPASDLYSLGVLLYELATGLNPFRSDDTASVIAAHLNDTPPRAHERSEGISRFFSEVIATLLAKTPDDRFASAEALGAVLDGGERSAWWSEREPDLRAHEARVPRIRVRREAGLHGREKSLASLHEAWAAARAGRGGIVYVEGEAGIGKTRLLDAFVRALAAEDAHLLYGCYPPSGGVGALSDAILDRFGEAGLADALRPYLSITPSLVPAFAALVKREEPPTGAPPLQGDALATVTTHLLRGLAAEKPTLWIMDDLQFAPPESRAIVRAMARAAEEHPALLVVAARPGVDVADFSRLESFRRVDVGRLSPREVIVLLEEAFQSAMLADKLGAKIAVKSDGVPFFIFEIIRGLKEGRLITQSEDGSYAQSQVISEIEVPSAVKDLIEQRMRDLTPAHRAILDVGAVQGPEFDPDLVARVREMKRVEVLETLADVERRGGIVRATGRAYRFDQNQIHDVVLSGVSEVLREEYHTMLAEAFAEREKASDDATGETAHFLAWHHLHGTRPEAGLPFLQEAVKHLVRGHRFSAAVDLMHRALGEPGLLEGPERGRTLAHLATVFRDLGQSDDEQEALDEAWTIAEAGDDALLKCQVGERIGWHLYARSKYEEAHAWLLGILELAEQSGHRYEEAVIQGHLGALCERTGRYDEADAHHDRSREIGEELGHNRLIVRALGNKSVVAAQQWRLDEACELTEEALRLAEAPANRAYNLASLGGLHLMAGRFEEAKDALERANALYHEIGGRMHAAMYTVALGGAAAALGRYDEAVRHYKLGLGILKETGHRDGVARCQLSYASLLIAMGRRDQAQELIEESLSVARALAIPPIEANALTLLGTAGADPESNFARALELNRELEKQGEVMSTLLGFARLRTGQGRADEARGMFEEALALAERIKAKESATTARVYLGATEFDGAGVSVAGRVECNLVAWKTSGNEAQLAEAHRLLMHLRDHAPEDSRESMIENVPLHREIMEAWDDR